MFTGKPCSRLQCVSICVLRVQEISSEYPVACGWQLHAWLAAPRLAGSSTLWLAAPRVVGSSTCGWQLHVWLWLAAPRVAGSSTFGWQLHLWLAAPRVAGSSMCNLVAAEAACWCTSLSVVFAVGQQTALQREERLLDTNLASVLNCALLCVPMLLTDHTLT